MAGHTPKLSDIGKLSPRHMAQLHRMLAGLGTRALHSRQAHWKSKLGGCTWRHGDKGPMSCSDRTILVGLSHLLPP